MYGINFYISKNVLIVIRDKGIFVYRWGVFIWLRGIGKGIREEVIFIVGFEGCVEFC